MSSFSAFTGTSFATGLPCFVIITVSHLACTSSMTARHFDLKEPAAILFIPPLSVTVIVRWSFVRPVRSSHPGHRRPDALSPNQSACGRTRFSCTLFLYEEHHPQRR